MTNKQRLLTNEGMNPITDLDQIGNQMPIIKGYHNQFLKTYKQDSVEELLTAENFRDENLIKEFNQSQENISVINEYLKSVRSPLYEIGCDANKDTFDRLIQHSWDQNPANIDAMLQVLEKPSIMSTGKGDLIVETIGNLLIHLYASLGNLQQTKAYSWFFKKLNYGPQKCIKLLDQSNNGSLKLSKHILEKDKLASEEAISKINEITKKTTDSLNQGMIDKILNKINLHSIMDALLANKVVIGGGLTIIFATISIQVYKNPEIFKQWYHFLRPNQILPQNTKTSNGKAIQFKTYTQIVNEPSTKMEHTSAELLEQLFDKFVLNLKGLFFKK